jgi:hypothetical protein
MVKGIWSQVLSRKSLHGEIFCSRGHHNFNATLLSLSLIRFSHRQRHCHRMRGSCLHSRSRTRGQSPHTFQVLRLAPSTCSFAFFCASWIIIWGFLSRIVCFLDVRWNWRCLSSATYSTYVGLQSPYSLCSLLSKFCGLGFQVFSYPGELAARSLCFASFCMSARLFFCFCAPLRCA